ncbi:MAG: hypothetical protein KDA57_17620 [Planctomycetales bacterium]|nr:hypothetical protein [Planctomycetales bacterium]
MAKKKRISKHERSRRQWEQERDQYKEFQRIAPTYKAHLKKHGCDLPFYDYIDSYTHEFARIKEEALKKHPSLLGIHEVSGEVYHNLEHSWNDLGYGHLNQVFYDIGADVSDYGQNSLDANLQGSAITFVSDDGETYTAIFIKKDIRCSFRLAEYKYTLKIPALLHELGHVTDIEQGKNFDVPNKRANIIEAEVFAHLFALEQLATRCLTASYRMLYEGLEDAIPKGGYLAQVAELVLQRAPEHNPIDWQRLDIPLPV